MFVDRLETFYCKKYKILHRLKNTKRNTKRRSKIHIILVTLFCIFKHPVLFPYRSYLLLVSQQNMQTDILGCSVSSLYVTVHTDFKAWPLNIWFQHLFEANMLVSTGQQNCCSYYSFPLQELFLDYCREHLMIHLMIHVILSHGLS